MCSYETQDIQSDVLWRSDWWVKCVTKHQGFFSISFPPILTQLCKIYEVKIDNEVCNKLGSNLDEEFQILASTTLKDGMITPEANRKMESDWRDQERLMNELKRMCQNLLTELRQKIAEKHKGKFDFFTSLPNKPKEEKWDDEVVYNLVSGLNEFKSGAKNMFLDEFKKKIKPMILL